MVCVGQYFPPLSSRATCGVCGSVLSPTELSSYLWCVWVSTFPTDSRDSDGFYVLNSPFWTSPATSTSPPRPSWSFHFQSIPLTILLPTVRCFSIWVRISRRCLLRAASTSLAAFPGHSDQQGFSDERDWLPCVSDGRFFVLP